MIAFSASALVLHTFLLLLLRHSAVHQDFSQTSIDELAANWHGATI
jgi:hypothetical protein